MSVDPALLRHAADKFASGKWRWNDGTREIRRGDYDLMLALLVAARAKGKRLQCYDTIRGATRFLGVPLGDWGRGRTAEQAVSALRMMAALSKEIDAVNPRLS